jgi:hypothetical protein
VYEWLLYRVSDAQLCRPRRLLSTLPPCVARQRLARNGLLWEEGSACHSGGRLCAVVTPKGFLCLY